MTNEEWLSEWASNVQYVSTDDLFRKVFHEVVCVDKPEPCEVKYAQRDDGKIEVSLVNDNTCSVLLDKK